MNSKRRQGRVQWRLRLLAVAALIAWLAGCGAPGPLISEQHPIRGSGNRPPPAPEAVRVSRGDTLYSIAFRYGLDWRDVARWNHIGAPYTIRVGDWVRLQPQPDMRPAVVVAESSPSDPGPRSGSAAEPRPAPPAGPDSGSGARPQPDARDEPTGDESTAQAASEPGARDEKPPDPQPEPEPAVRQERPGESPPPGPTRSVAGVSWRWPTSGRITREFDAGASRKGILIAGENGQPIRAAAQGEVVYSGNGLIGYGELIIIKHSGSMLSAYAHNRERLVVEGDRVQSGDLIARMGRNERDETVLHFEIRRDGKPTDPVQYLPRR